MSEDNIGIIRRGWQEAATTLAPHVVGLGDFLERRLEEAVRVSSLDETVLLGIVEGATEMAVDNGSAEVAHLLGRRLRRTVYEYLLSLDATSPQESRPLQLDERVSRPDAVLIGADEVAALGRVADAEAAPGWTAGQAAVAPVEATSWTARLGNGASAFPASAAGGWSSPPEDAEAPSAPAETGVPPRHLYVFHREDETPGDQPGEQDPASDSTESPAVAPRFGFHIGDPNDLVGQVPPTDANLAGGEADRPSAFNGDPVEFDSPAPGPEPPPPPRASFADPSTWPKPATPTLRSGRLHDAVEPVHDAPALPHGNGAAGIERLSQWSSPWPETVDVQQPASIAEPAELPAVPGPEVAGAGQPSDITTPSPEGTTTPEEHAPAAAPPGLAPITSPAEPESPVLNGRLEVEEVPESDLSELRIALEEKLRKKRCDDAAAMLQQVAQEVGGRLVAEMALDAGDRCRALGKANAALNCYLAASRADPVYEAPLARLADICIDDQDIDLAVSYLERIARLTRLRGDNKGALRIYRKIATIAPYRDDVLEMLMRAQTTGRFDS